MEKEKWSRIAAHLEAEEGGKTWNAKFLKRTFMALPKNAFWNSELITGARDFDFLTRMDGVLVKAGWNSWDREVGFDF
jgi:hypothetical protein